MRVVRRQKIQPISQQAFIHGKELDFSKPQPEFRAVPKFNLPVEKNEKSIFPNNLLSTACFDCLEDVIVFNLFRDITCLKDSLYDYVLGESIEIKVKATIIAPEKKVIEREQLNSNMEKRRSESNFVGEVYKANSDSRLKEGTSVTSLRKCDVKSRLTLMPEKSLVEIPNDLDAGEAVAVVSNYLPAFGALHHGSKCRKGRFFKSPFIKKTVLVTGGSTNGAEAVAKLSLLGGASKVFLVNSRKGKALSRFGSNRVVSLDGDPDEWLPCVHGSMDIIVDLEYPKDLPAVKASMSKNGRLVCCQRAKNTTKRKKTWFSDFEKFTEHVDLCMVPGVSIYNFDFMCEKQHEEVMEDLKFLFWLLEKRKLRPAIDKYIKVRDVATVQDRLLRRPRVGAGYLRTMARIEGFHEF